MGQLSQPWPLETVARFPSTCQCHHYKKSVRAQSNVVCQMEFWRCNSLGVYSKWALQTMRIFIFNNWNEFMKFYCTWRYPALISLPCSLAAGQYETPHCTNNHNKNSGIERNRTATTPAYSPDLAPSDYHLAYFLRGSNLEDVEAVEVSLIELFPSKTRDWYMIINLAENGSRP